MGDTHIRVLQIYRKQPAVAPFVEVSRLYELLNVTLPVQQQFVYSAVDTLANLRYIIHGNIPRKGTEGAIDLGAAS